MVAQESAPSSLAEFSKPIIDNYSTHSGGFSFSAGGGAGLPYFERQNFLKTLLLKSYDSNFELSLGAFKGKTSSIKCKIKMLFIPHLNLKFFIQIGEAKP